MRPPVNRRRNELVEEAGTPASPITLIVRPMPDPGGNLHGFHRDSGFAVGGNFPPAEKPEQLEERTRILARKTIVATGH